MLYIKKKIKTLKWQINQWRKNLIFITILPVTFIIHVVYNFLTFLNIVYYLIKIIKNINKMKIIKIYQNEKLRKKTQKINNSFFTFVYIVFIERPNKKAFEIVYSCIKSFNTKEKNNNKIIIFFYFLRNWLYIILFGYSKKLLGNNDIISCSIRNQWGVKEMYRGWKKMGILEKIETFSNGVFFNIFMKLNDTNSIDELKRKKIIIIKKKIKTNNSFFGTKGLNKIMEKTMLKETTKKMEQILSETRGKEFLEKAISLTKKNTDNSMVKKLNGKEHLHKYIKNKENNEIISIGCTTKSEIIIDKKPTILTEKNLGSLKQNTIEYHTPIQIRNMSENDIERINSKYYHQNKEIIDRNLDVDLLKNINEKILTHIDKNEFEINNKTFKEKMVELNNEEMLEAINNKNEYNNLNRNYIENLKKEGIIKNSKEIEFLEKININSNHTTQKQQIEYYLNINNLFTE